MTHDLGRLATGGRLTGRTVTRVTVLFLCCVLALVAAGQAVPPKADAAPPPIYTPRNSTTFNVLKGSLAKQLTIITEINKAIDASPRGSTIKMAQYLFNIDSTSNKLIAAHRRGVNVQVLIDDGNQTKQSQAVTRELGRDKRKSSYVTTCSHSCMSNTASVMHAKFYLFSQAGRARYVSMVSSANPFSGNTYYSWNNNHTIVGDVRIFNSLSKYFTDMIQDRNNPNYYRTTTSGKYKLYLFPRAPKRGVTTVVPLDVLKHVTCSGAGKGYGRNGKTVIRIAMWGWTSARNDVAKQLWALHNRGCKVEVILNSAVTGTLVFRTLLKPSKKYGTMPVYDAWIDGNHNGLPSAYMHHKLVAINGKWFGHAQTKVSYTGSQNFSGPATTANNDIVLRIKDNGVYNAYNNNLNYIRNHYTKRIRKAPKTTPIRANGLNERLLNVDED